MDAVQDLGLAETTPFTDDFSSLFGVSPVSALEEVRERTLARLQDFFRAGKVVDRLDHERLAASFQNAEIPQEPVSMEEYTDYILAEVVPHCVNMASPRCLGHMTGAVAQFSRPLSELMLVLNQNQVKQEASLSFTVLERQAIAMLHRLVYARDDAFYAEHGQKSSSTLGIMASGSTLANITALWIARNLAFAPRNGSGGPEHDGFAAALRDHGCSRAVIVGSRLMHYSIHKAAALLGLGSRNVVTLPVDKRHRLDILSLRKAIARFRSEGVRILALVGTAGTTDCGSIDPLADLAAVAAQNGIHFHVDAAWGTPLLFSRRHRSKLSGIECADSVTLDGHKQLHLPAGANLLVLRDPDAARVIEKEANYMLHQESADLGKRSLEGSRAANALFLHGALSVIGRLGYEALIDRNIRIATTMANLIRDRCEYELLGEPETNIVLYRYLPPPWRSSRPKARTSATDLRHINTCNERLQKAQSAAGRSFVARTRLTEPNSPDAASVALRAVIINPLTSESDCAGILDEQAEIGDLVWRTGGASDSPRDS